jgi:ATP-dependent Clp protease ATP-binding subunit ClpA
LTDRRWTVKSEEALVRARGLARDKAHAAVTPGHLLAALFEADSFVSLYLRRLGSEPERTLARVSTYLADLPAGSSPDVELALSPELSAALGEAARWAAELDDEYVSAENLLLGLAASDDDIGLTLQAAGVGRGGWQGVVRQRREVWRRQVKPRPEPLEFDPALVRVLMTATRATRGRGVVVEPAHVFAALVSESPALAALLAAWGLDPGQLSQAAAAVAERAPRVPAQVTVDVVSESLHRAIRAATQSAHHLGEPGVGPLAMLRGLARGGDEVAELLRGVDEMLAVLQERVQEPLSRLAGAMMAQQRAMQQSDLETAARLLHGEIPILRQEIEALGPAEAALVGLLDERSAHTASSSDEEYQRVRDALDTAHIRDVSRRLLRWLGDQDRPPGDPVELAAFCATVTPGTVTRGTATSGTASSGTATPGEGLFVHDGLITGREAGRAAGRLALLGQVTRIEDTVRLTAAGLRCLEDRGGDIAESAAATV